MAETLCETGVQRYAEDVANWYLEALVNLRQDKHREGGLGDVDRSGADRQIGHREHCASTYSQR